MIKLTLVSGMPFYLNPEACSFITTVSSDTAVAVGDRMYYVTEPIESVVAQVEEALR